MNRENRRISNQTKREIDVENTKGAIFGAMLMATSFIAMILYWIFVGY